MKIETIGDMVKWRLCLGCGACAYGSHGALRMVEDPDHGFRPVKTAHCEDAALRDALDFCPGLETRIDDGMRNADLLDGIAAGVGPVMEVWEGYATDPDTRFNGSSGGALTALARYAVERAGMYGVLHVASDSGNPLHNRTVMSRSYQELLSATGSRYAPASVCEKLHEIENAPGPCVLIGQPSEIAAARKARALRPELDRKIGITLSFFCAGSPATRGTVELLKSKGVDPAQVERLRYRGRGWPGMFAAWLKGDDEPALEMTYAESWGFVQAYRPWATHIWPDGCGEHADISCGDPWYRKVRPGEQGSSLVVVRSEAGRRLVQGAMNEGYLALVPSSVSRVVESQRNLLTKKGAVWGRLMCMRLLGLPTPVHAGYRMFPTWLRIPFPEKLRSTVGTLRRILTRGYLKPATTQLSGACGKEQMQ
jgi:coenzyme F420 hydrogenase subunit beta